MKCQRCRGLCVNAGVALAGGWIPEVQAAAVLSKVVRTDIGYQVITLGGEPQRGLTSWRRNLSQPEVPLVEHLQRGPIQHAHVGAHAHEFLGGLALVDRECQPGLFGMKGQGYGSAGACGQGQLLPAAPGVEGERPDGEVAPDGQRLAVG